MSFVKDVLDEQMNQKSPIYLSKHFQTWLKVIEDRNVTFAEFQQKVGFEALKRSLQRFQRLSFNEDDIFRTRIKITWLSLMELCFQPEFQEDSWKPIEEQVQPNSKLIAVYMTNFYQQTVNNFELKNRTYYKYRIEIFRQFIFSPFSQFVAGRCQGLAVQRI